MSEVTLRPMTQDEFDTYRDRLIREYAADHVAAGNWSEDESLQRATDQFNDLLPDGTETDGQELYTALDADGNAIGLLWLDPHGRPGGAWIYDIEVSAEHRGKGYGRALLQAGEDEARRLGVSSIGLNVFGHNDVARSLYESAGYRPTAIQMRKDLS
jgi:ribosomal protein S18 acetylase RimI-like enzyme